MIMNKLAIFTIMILALVFVQCGGNPETSSSSEESSTSAEATPEPEKSTESYDPKRGEGKFDEANLKLGALDKAMAEKGEAIANTKCISCHKLTGEKLVGPGWKGVLKEEQDIGL